MAKRGRKNKYETDVKAHFSQISKWLESGATERQIAQNLGITALLTAIKQKKKNYEKSLKKAVSQLY